MTAPPRRAPGPSVLGGIPGIVLSRYGLLFLRTFLGWFCWCFACLQVFLAVSVVVPLLIAHPYMPLGRLVAQCPDVLIPVLPLSLPFAMVLAGLLASAQIRRSQGYLWCRLAGRSPRLLHGPIVLFAVLLCGGLGWAEAAAIPNAVYRVRFELADVALSSDALALRMKHRPEWLPGLHMTFEEGEGSRFKEVALVSRRSTRPFAVMAADATMAVSPGGERLVVSCDDGWLLGLDEDGAIGWDADFEHLELTLDAKTLTARSKRTLLDLKYYTDEELGRLGVQRHKLRASGVALKKRQERRVRAVPRVRWLRTQSALVPFLVILLYVVLLGGVVAQGLRWRQIAFVVASLLLIGQQLILSSMVGARGPSTPMPILMAPVLEVVTLVAVVLWMERRQEGAA